MKKYKVLVLTLIILMSIYFVSCGKNKEPVQTPSETPQQQEIEVATPEVTDKPNWEIDYPEETVEPTEEPVVIDPDLAEVEKPEFMYSNTLVMGNFQKNGIEVVDKDTVLHDDNSLKITYINTVTSYVHHSTINIRFLNKTDKDITVKVDKLIYLNGVGFDTDYKLTIPANSYSVKGIDIETGYTDISLADNIYTIEMPIIASNGINTKNIDIAFALKEGLSEYEFNVHHIQDKGYILYDATSFFINSETNERGLLGFIYNNSNKSLRIYDTSILVNGIEISEWSKSDYTIEPGRYANFDISINTNDLMKYGIKSIENIAIKPKYNVDGSTIDGDLGTWLVIYSNM